jgi:hypothetical protein
MRHDVVDEGQTTFLFVSTYCDYFEGRKAAVIKLSPWQLDLRDNPDNYAPSPPLLRVLDLLIHAKIKRRR